MAYIGLEPSNSFVSLKRQVITGDGTASYTLDHSVASVNDVAIFVNNVRQDPAGYSISGTALTLGGTIESSDDCYVIFLGQALQTVTPDSDTITAAMLKSDSVTTAKIASNAVNLTSKVTGTLPVANGGTNLTSGFANGITMADQWRLTAGKSDSSDITANLERVDTPTTPLIGTGMSESSGIFTFPQTGYYLITVQGFFQFTNQADNQAHIQTYISSDSGSNYDIVATCTSGSNSSSNVSYFTNFSSAFVDVTNASTFRVKFTTASLGGSISGITSYNQTAFTFLRLGDT